MTQTKFRPPGEILKDNFQEQKGLNQIQLGRALGVLTICIDAVVNGTWSLTAETDLRLCKFLGFPEGHFLARQSAYDIADA